MHPQHNAFTELLTVYRAQWCSRYIEGAAPTKGTCSTASIDTQHVDVS